MDLKSIKRGMTQSDQVSRTATATMPYKTQRLSAMQTVFAACSIVNPPNDEAAQQERRQPQAQGQRHSAAAHPSVLVIGRLLVQLSLPGCFVTMKSRRRCRAFLVLRLTGCLRVQDEEGAPAPSRHGAAAGTSKATPIALDCSSGDDMVRFPLLSLCGRAAAYLWRNGHWHIAALGCARAALHVNNTMALQDLAPKAPEVPAVTPPPRPTANNSGPLSSRWTDGMESAFNKTAGVSTYFVKMVPYLLSTVA
jgi:hypothetical protein